MSNGEGLVGLLYAIRDLVETFAMMIITGVAVIAFFWLIVKFIGNKMGWFTGGGGPWGGTGKRIPPNNILYAIFILFVILAIYSLIALTAALFGVNSSPSGGLLVE